MYQLRYILITTSIVLIFLFNASLLNVVGWPYTEASGSIITKIHPAFYTLLLLAVLQMAYGGREVLRTLFSPVYMLFIAASIIILIRAILIVQAGVTEGELTAVIVTWVMPALLVIGLLGWDKDVFERWGTGLRLFFVFNSLMALAERVVGHRFIPGFIDFQLMESRAAGLLAHPLNGALLTGILITILISARPGKRKPWMRVPEILLHVAAMFAFGGRGALVFTTMIIVLSGLMAGQKQGEARLSVLQRILPYAVVLLGLALVALPIEFVDATLDRFTNDDKSSETRNAAIQLLGVLDVNQLLWGIDANERKVLLDFFHTPFGIEISWIALIIIYGLVAALPIIIMLPLFMFNAARNLDRSAFYATILFLLVVTGSLSLGSKSLLVNQAIIMMFALCQRRLAPMLGFLRADREAGNAPAARGAAERGAADRGAADRGDEPPSFLR